MITYRTNFDARARELQRDVDALSVEMCERLLLAAAEVERLALDVAYLTFIPLDARMQAITLADELPGKVSALIETACAARERAEAQLHQPPLPLGAADTAP